MRQLAILAFSAMALLIAPPAARCDDLDDLKAAHEAFYKALNARNPDGLVAALHQDVAAFLRDNPFPVRKPTTEFLKTVWADVERSDATMIDPQYVVIGNTGVVWGHATAVGKMKDGPEETVHSRVSYTYVKSGGKWLVLSVHISAIPSGN